MKSFWSSLTGKSNNNSSSSGSNYNSSSSSISHGTTETEILASAQAILEANSFPLSLLSSQTDSHTWQHDNDDMKVTLSQIMTLKKHVESQNLSSNISLQKKHSAVEDFCSSPAATLKGCLQFVPDVTVQQSLIGPGNCLFNVLAREGVTQEIIASVLNFHRQQILHDFAVTMPRIDIELLLAIRLYTVQSPIPFYQYLNRLLNSPDRSGLENIAPFMRLLIKASYALEDAGYGNCGQAYRCVKIGSNLDLQKKFDNWQEAFKPETLITFAAFTSVTKECRNVHSFGQQTGDMFFHFLNVRGINISGVSIFPDEAEILIVPPSVFRVAGTFTLYGNLIVSLTHVEQQGASYLERNNTIFTTSKEVMYFVLL
jgi:hypothetical protein